MTRIAMILVLLGISALSSGCATTVPPQAVELSMAVGERVAATQSSHEAFVTEYFALWRARFEDFVQYRWTPEFLETFVRDSHVADLLAQPHPFDEDDLARLRQEFTASGIDRLEDAVGATERALGDAERGQIALEFAEAAWAEIERRREELISPLRVMETETLTALRANYAQLAAMNGSVTGYLQSLVAVSEMGEDVLHRMHLQDERDAVLARVGDVNGAIEKALAGAAKAEEIVDRLKEILGAE